MTHAGLRLRADGLDFWVDVHLHRFDGEWQAMAELAGEPELWVGRSGSRCYRDGSRCARPSCPTPGS